MLSRSLSCVLALAAGGFVLAARPRVSSAGSQETTSGFTGADAPPLQIVHQRVAMDEAHHLATFEIGFNRKPDFYTIDPVGRPADSFQYAINPDWSGKTTDLQLGPDQVRDIVRGDEIRTSGKVLIRDATPVARPQPNSGGWGPVVADTPFHLSGDAMSFTVPMSGLRVSRGAFSYELFTTRFGATASDVQGHAIPLPPAVWTGLATLAAMAGVVGSRRLRRGASGV